MLDILFDVVYATSDGEATAFFLLIFAAPYIVAWRRKKFHWSNIAAPILAFALWLVMVSFDIGTPTNLVNLIEAPVFLIFIAILINLKVFVFDILKNDHIRNSYFVLALSLLFVVALRMVFPFTPE